MRVHDSFIPMERAGAAFYATVCECVRVPAGDCEAGFQPVPPVFLGFIAIRATTC